MTDDRPPVAWTDDMSADLAVARDYYELVCDEDIARCKARCAASIERVRSDLEEQCMVEMVF